ncbi:hypothetical protein JCM10450v2_007617 [Rhodotorula kratochvilovae]
MGAGGATYAPAPDPTLVPEVAPADDFKRVWAQRLLLAPSSRAYARKTAELSLLLGEVRRRIEAFARGRKDAVLRGKCAEPHAARTVDRRRAQTAPDQAEIDAVIYGVMQAELAHRRQVRAAQAEQLAEQLAGPGEHSLAVRRHRREREGEGVRLGLRAGWRYFRRAY